MAMLKVKSRLREEKSRALGRGVQIEKPCWERERVFEIKFGKLRFEVKERWKLKHKDCQRGHIMCQFLSIGFNLWLISKVLHKISIHFLVCSNFFLDWKFLLDLLNIFQ